jgi:hypothetical protein
VNKQTNRILMLVPWRTNKCSFGICITLSQDVFYDDTIWLARRNKIWLSCNLFHAGVAERMVRVKEAKLPEGLLSELVSSLLKHLLGARLVFTNSNKIERLCVDVKCVSLVLQWHWGLNIMIRAERRRVEATVDRLVSGIAAQE